MNADQRARNLILETEHFDDLGLGSLAANARMVARDTLELIEELGAERSARQAIQKNHDDYCAYHRTHCFTRNGASRAA